MARERKKPILGISVCNPVDIEETYLMETIDYAIAKGYNHMQFIGPIHDPVKGNVDGMALYLKYDRFNQEKDLQYVEQTKRIVNAACEKTSAAGIKSYVWHHELDLPSGFQQAYPQACNEYGDIEVSSPEVKDFLEWKIRDFFTQYPKMDGIILTLHETKVPLLKLKKQKLSKVERVKFVTEILYNTCRELGKELVVRPFASVAEDYAMMMQAYSEISEEMVVMDKWTQFDWSLCLPHNAFFAKIEKNPLLVETDIFGEYFGKGKFPIMLKDHIVQKYAYCSQFDPAGYCSRVDRGGAHPFGTVNEVNLDIMHACLTGEDVDAAIDRFFAEKYGQAGVAVRLLMEPTEQIQKKILYLNGYYFSELSRFPKLNHCKNHFYFELMRKKPVLASEEWYIPPAWERGSVEALLTEKEEAVEQATQLYEKVLQLQGKIPEKDFENLRKQFLNLKICAGAWKALAEVFVSYIRFFEEKKTSSEALDAALAQLENLRDTGMESLGSEFYCVTGDTGTGDKQYFDCIGNFAEEVRASFASEVAAYECLAKQAGVTDFVLCGGATEGHSLQKEVNFSDTQIINGRLCRIPGNNRGKKWSTINAHGWFSYALQVEPGKKQKICICCTCPTGQIKMKVTLGKQIYEIAQECAAGQDCLLELPYTADADETAVRIRFDRISGHVPCVYTIVVQQENG